MNSLIPIQYQESRTTFLGMDIIVDPRVFIPRPETELLVKVVSELSREKNWQDPLFLDMCTGSGVVLLGLTKLISPCRVVGVDISEDALYVANTNIEKHDRCDKTELICSDLFAEIGAEYNASFDAIVSNPPYVSKKDYAGLDPWVKAEPKIALCSGDEGMDHLNVIASQSARYLKSDGFLAVEIGYDQADKVKTLLNKYEFRDVAGFKDFNGYERVVVGWKNG